MVCNPASLRGGMEMCCLHGPCPRSIRPSRVWTERRCFFTLYRTRGFPQPSLSAAARLGRPARASESSADCATRWSWFPRPDELTVGASAVPRVVQRMAGSCQPFFVIRRQSWITTHITISASRARAPLARRAAQVMFRKEPVASDQRP